jgi:Flp pilus assembly protein TadD
VGELAGDVSPGAVAVGEEEAEALRLMAEAAKAEPHDPDYYHILGEGLLRAGKVPEALRMCREAVERDPVNAEYRFALGCAEWRAGQVARAERAFREALQRRPDDPVSLNALGAALVRLHRDTEAVTTLEKALKLDPQGAGAHSNLGVALWAAGDHPGVVRSFQRAIRLDSEEPDFHRNLARAQRALGRPAEAATVLRNMIRRWPDRAGLYLDLAETFHEAGQPDEATRALDEAHRLDPTAIAERPRSRELRDTLRLEGVRDEARRGRRSRANPLAIVHDAALELVHTLAGLSRKVQVATVGVLLLTLGLGWFAWKVAPHYVTHYLVEDDLADVARAPVKDDNVVRARLRRTVERRGLAALDVSRCEVKSDPGWRTLTCAYAVRAQVLPGLWRDLHFELDVAEPYLVEPDPIVF